MPEGYSEAELAQIKRDAQRKREYEEKVKLYVAESKGIEIGEAKARAEIIRTMYKNGFDIETISKALSLDIDYVKEVLSK